MELSRKVVTKHWWPCFGLLLLAGLIGLLGFLGCVVGIFFTLPIAVGATAYAYLDIFCAELGLDRQRTHDWCVVHAVLDACWDFEDGTDWRSAVAYAEQTLRF